MLEFENGNLQPPLSLYLFISTACPLNCRICARKIITGAPKSPDTLGRFLSKSLFGIDQSDLFVDYKGEIENISKRRYELKSPSIRVLWDQLNDVFKLNLEEKGLLSEISQMVYTSKPGDITVFKKIPALIEDMNFEDPCRLYICSIEVMKTKLIRDMFIQMPREDYVRVIKEGSEMGIENIYFTSALGEPLAEESELLTLMELSKKCGYIGHLATNGYIRNDSALKKIVDIKWDGVYVSLDGFNPKTHDNLRDKKGSYDHAVDFIKELIDLRGRQKSLYPKVGVSFVVNKNNYSEIIDHFKLVNSLGVDSVYYSGLRAYSKDVKGYLSLDENDRKQLSMMINSNRAVWENSEINCNLEYLASEHDLGADSPLITPSNRIFSQIAAEAMKDRNCLIKDDCYTFSPAHYHLCLEPWSTMVVTTNGSILQCCSSSIPLINMNVKDYSLKEIWSSREYHNLRHNFISGNLPSECRENCLPSIEQHHSVLLEEYIKWKEKQNFDMYDNGIKQKFGVRLRKGLKRLKGTFHSKK